MLAIPLDERRLRKHGPTCCSQTHRNALRRSASTTLAAWGRALDDDDLTVLVGRELVGFRLTELLGAGGMAAVYRGENVLDPSIVRALKVVRPELASRPGFAKRFAREASILERLQNPRVVRFYGVRRSADGWLVMELELLHGRALSAIEGRVPATTALGWLAEAADGLAAVHALGIVHRDVKPSNLFLTDEGSVKVLDFGIARALPEGSWSTPLTAAGIVPGTPLYLAPEVIAGSEPTAAADVYGLGVVLYVLLAGHHPLAPPGSAPKSPEDLFRARWREPVLPSLGDAPKEVRALLDGALAENPETRFRDAAAFATAVRAARHAPDPSNATAGASGLPLHSTENVAGVPPTVLAAPPPRVPGPVPVTAETAPPSIQGTTRSEAHSWLQPALGRHAVAGLIGLGLVALAITALTVRCGDGPLVPDGGLIVAIPDASDTADASTIVVESTTDAGRGDRAAAARAAQALLLGAFGRDGGSGLRIADAGSLASTDRTAAMCERARACCLACALETQSPTPACGVLNCDGVASWSRIGPRGPGLCRAAITDWRVFLVRARRRIPPACGGSAGLYTGRGSIDCDRIRHADYRASLEAHDIDPNSIDCSEGE